MLVESAFRQADTHTAFQFRADAENAIQMTAVLQHRFIADRITGDQLIAMHKAIEAFIKEYWQEHANLKREALAERAKTMVSRLLVTPWRNLREGLRKLSEEIAAEDAKFMRPPSYRDIPGADVLELRRQEIRGLIREMPAHTAVDFLVRHATAEEADAAADGWHLLGRLSNSPDMLDRVKAAYLERRLSDFHRGRQELPRQIPTLDNLVPAAVDPVEVAKQIAGHKKKREDDRINAREIHRFLVAVLEFAAIATDTTMHETFATFLGVDLDKLPISSVHPDLAAAAAGASMDTPAPAE